MIEFLKYLGTMVGIYGILALSLNLQYGITGLLNFGHVAFFALGAYTSALLTLNLGVPMLVGALAGMMMAAIIGGILSLSIGRLKADYWAIVTLAAGELLRHIFNNTTQLTGGAYGLRGIPRPFGENSWISPSLISLLLVLGFLVMTYFFITFLTKCPFGRVLKAIREEEFLPKAFGKDIFKFRQASMVLGGAIAGLAGSLYAHYITFITPDFFTPTITFLIWTMVIVGGRGNHKGAILGALLIQGIYVSTRFIKDFINLPGSFQGLRLFLIGLTLILFILYKDDGILPEQKQIYEEAQS